MIAGVAGFNSSMVRLRFDKVFQNLKDPRMFQFLYGPIKIDTSQSSSSSQNSFQFLYGPIKIISNFRIFKIQFMFQFLYGPIKIDTSQSSSSSQNSFQFLYGPIKIPKLLPS